ncbi:membrane protein [Exiguobacterium mexicanum]|nr:membrane protein [Exiguobacterium mexicanum]
MNATAYEKVEDNPRFKELVRKRSRFSWLLSIITLVLYVGFIFLIAFDPSWLGTPISEGSYITRGIPVGVGLIVISFVLTGLYVIRANGEYNRLTAEILKEVEK